MSRKQADLVWMRDLLDHMQKCRENIEWVRDESTVHYLTKTMLGDLDACRKLCVKLNRRAALQAAG